MKKGILLALLALCIASTPTLAEVNVIQSTGPSLHDSYGSPMAVFTTKPATVKNTTLTGTKAYSNHSSASKASVIKWTCTNGSGVAAPCRVYPNGQSTYIVSPTGEGVRGIHPDVRYFRFAKYSSGSSSDSIVVTSEQQKK